MENKLKVLYLDFLKFFFRQYEKDRKIWFGVRDLKERERKIKETIFNYERETFLEFCKKIKDILFAKNPLAETLTKWSMGNWDPYYFFKFLKDKKIIDFQKNGRTKIIKKDFLDFFPKPLKEDEVKEKIEKKLKRKLSPHLPSNFFLQTKIKSHFDQFPISVSSTIFLTSKILEYLPLYGEFLFVGDDDLMSIYLSLADPKIRCFVVDIDDDLLKKIQEISKKFGLKIETKKLNIFKQKRIGKKFIGFLSSPVYTFEGVKVFSDFGVNQLGEDGGYVFLNLADEAIGNRYIFLEDFFAKKMLKIEEVIKGKIYYPWQLIHFEDKVILQRYKKMFDEKVVKNSPIISSSLWIFSFIPFKMKKPEKQPFYAYI